VIDILLCLYVGHRIQLDRFKDEIRAYPAIQPDIVSGSSQAGVNLARKQTEENNVNMPLIATICRDKGLSGVRTELSRHKSRQSVAIRVDRKASFVYPAIHPAKLARLLIWQCQTQGISQRRTDEQGY
jgi:hypothetical protein